ncbi:MAG: hypothetical protein RI897_3940 [Verrucomicrobiota bacterium]|jgi:hypothetical protein
MRYVDDPKTNGGTASVTICGGHEWSDHADVTVWQAGVGEAGTGVEAIAAEAEVSG